MRLPIVSAAEVQKQDLVEAAEEPFWDIHKHGVSQSMLGIFNLCPMKAEYRIRQGLESKSGGMTTALSFGDFFHRVLDNVYTFSRGLDYDHLLQNLDGLVEDATELIYQEDKEKLLLGIASGSAYNELELISGIAQVTLQGYFRRWVEDFRDLEWLDLERIFEVPYTLSIPGSMYNTTIPLRGKYDGVFRDKQGKIWLFETKTKSYADESISDKLNFDIQVMMYLMTMKHVYGETPGGVIYNIIRRPLLRQKVKEELPEFLDRIEEDILAKSDHYFVRYHASILPEELEAWEENDFKYLMQQFYRWSQGEFNFRNSGSCMMWNRPCEFMRVCSGGDISHLQKRKHVFPELQEASTAE